MLAQRVCRCQRLRIGNQAAARSVWRLPMACLSGPRRTVHRFYQPELRRLRIRARLREVRGSKHLLNAAQGQAGGVPVGFQVMRPYRLLRFISQ